MNGCEQKRTQAVSNVQAAIRESGTVAHAEWCAAQPSVDEVAVLRATAGRTAILGGTFNPIHIGHMRLAIEMVETLKLATVECMPCALPPHKVPAGLLSFEMRLSLVQAAVESVTALQASALEGTLDGPSYTWNMLNAWQAAHGGTRPLFIVGAEDFAGIDKWMRGLDLPGVTDFIVVPRGVSDHAHFGATVSRLWRVAAQPVAGTSAFWHAPLGAGFALFVPLPYLDISATRLRALWLAGRDVRFLVPYACCSLLEHYRSSIAPVWSQDGAHTV